MQAQIKKGSAVKRALSRFFFAVGTAYVRARRVLDGVALEFAHTAPSMARVMAATFTAAVLYPLYRCVCAVQIAACMLAPWGVGSRAEQVKAACAGRSMQAPLVHVLLVSSQEWCTAWLVV